KDGAETEAAVRGAAPQRQPIERPPQVDTGQPRKQTEGLRPAGKRLVATQCEGTEPIQYEGRQHQQQGNGVRQTFQGALHRGLTPSNNSRACAARAPQSNHSTTQRRPASPMRASSSGRCSSSGITRSSAAGLSHGTMRPVSGTRIVSAVPPESP